jgi:large subunit ribosomal protein L10
MNKEQKKEVVAELTEELKGAEAVLAIDYRGISVPQAAELRTGLREAGARFRVVKNRLTLLAADAAGTDELKDHLSGPTARALGAGDGALAAKTISRLGGEWELLDYKGGVMNGEALDPDSFQTIAKLPGREQLNAQFAGIVASPLTGLVRGLGSMVQGLAGQLQQIADQGLVSGEAPDAPKDEKSEPDPDPEESSEESSQEDLPDEASEESAEVVEQTGEGDAEPGEAQEDVGEGGEEGATQDTSEDSDTEEKKEEGE